MAGSFSITLDEFKGGFLNRNTIRSLVDARKAAIARATGEQVRRRLSRTMPKARPIAMGSVERQERQLPSGVRLYAPNPSPGIPRIRIAKRSTSLQNLSRPEWMVDNDASPNRVIIGPVKLSDPPAPKLLETGGTKLSRTRRRVRRIGGGGEIRVNRGVYNSSSGRQRFGKLSPSMATAYPDTGGIAKVVYIRLRTQKQVERAQTINDSMYSPARRVVMRPRYYMKQAVAATIASPEFGSAVNRLYRAAVSAMRGSKAVMRRAA